MVLMVIMVRMPNDDIYPQAGVENKLHACNLFAAMPVCWSVCGRSVAYPPTRWMIHVC